MPDVAGMWDVEKVVTSLSPALAVPIGAARGYRVPAGSGKRTTPWSAPVTRNRASICPPVPSVGRQVLTSCNTINRAAATAVVSFYSSFRSHLPFNFSFSSFTFDNAYIGELNLLKQFFSYGGRRYFDGVFDAKVSETLGIRNIVNNTRDNPLEIIQYTCLYF